MELRRSKNHRQSGHVSGVIPLRLFKFDNAGLDLAMSFILVALIIGSRLLVFGNVPWEQDEAYFGCAILDFNPAHHHPHPPWFPLWIVIGKVFAVLCDNPLLGLQLTNLVATSLMIFPLVSLAARFVPQRFAVLSSLLLMSVSGTWLASVRAMSSPAATALLVTGFAIFVDKNRSRLHSILGAGSLAAGVLIRPHFALPAVFVLAILFFREFEHRRTVLVTFVAVGCLGVIGLAASAGGPRILVDALNQHANLHFGALDEADMSFSALGLSRSLSSTWVTAMWIGLTGMGIFTSLRTPQERFDGVLLSAGIVAPLSVLIFWLADPGHPRYFFPLLTFSSVFVVRGLLLFGKTAGTLIIGAAIAFNLVTLLPNARTCREDKPPAFEAVGFALDTAWANGYVVVLDSKLSSFSEYQQMLKRRPVAVVCDNQISSGATAAPPLEFVVAVIDRSTSRTPVPPGEWSRRFRSENPLMRATGKDRFLDVEVIIRPKSPWL